MNGMNGMVMVPVITPYGTQLMPMAMNQLMAMNNQATQSNKKTTQQQQLQQQQLQQLQLQQQLQVQAQLIQKQQSALLGQAAGNQAPNNNTIGT